MGAYSPRTSTDPLTIPAPVLPDLRVERKQNRKPDILLKLKSAESARCHDNGTQNVQRGQVDKGTMVQWYNCPGRTCPFSALWSTHLPLSGSSSRPPHSPERVPSAGRGGVCRERKIEGKRKVS